MQPFTEEAIERIEREAFGIVVSIDPFQRFRDMLGKACPAEVSLDRFASQPDGDRRTFMVLVSEVRKRSTKKGDPMANFSVFTSMDEQMYITVFPRQYAKAMAEVHEGEYALITVQKNTYRGSASYNLEAVRNLSRP